MRNFALPLSVLTLLLTSQLYAATFTLSAFSRGCINSSEKGVCGQSLTPSGNFYTGVSPDSSESRSFFIFDLGGVSGNILSAELFIELTPTDPSPGYFSGALNEVVAFHELGSESIEIILNENNKMAAFDAIPVSPLLGFSTLSPFDYGAEFYTQSLGSNWVDALNAAGNGQFGVGGVLASLSNLVPAEGVFGGSFEDRFELRIVTDSPDTIAPIPLPANVLLLGSALVALGAAAGRGRKNRSSQFIKGSN